MPNSLTTYTLEETAPLRSSTIALLHKNSLRFSAANTIICPRKAIVLGWVWSNGTLQASPHKLAALSSVEPPTTVQGLRSFVEAYMVLSHALPRFVELRDLPGPSHSRERIQRQNCVGRRTTAGLQNRPTYIGRQPNHHNPPTSRCPNG